MRRKIVPMTMEQVKAREEREQRDRAEAEAQVNACLDAMEAGVDIDTAARAAGLTGDAPQCVAPPVLPRKAAPRLRVDGWTAKKQRDFLQHLAGNGCVSQACDAVGMSRQSAYALRQRAPSSVFAIGWDVAIHLARQALLDEATERAIRGREVPVWYHGEQVGTRIVHNDRLVMFLLGRQQEPLHPMLDPRELIQLFPAMLRMVDTILPPAFSADRIAELTGGRGKDAEG